MASGLRTSALHEENEVTLQNVISLFVVENLAAMSNEETNQQRSKLVGTWDCDFSAMPEYAGAQMYIVLGADGSGKTYADFSGSGNPSLTAEYTFFAYDSPEFPLRDCGFSGILTFSNGRKELIRMTSVKEQFMQMLPQNLPGVPDDEVQYMINILVKWNKPNEPVETLGKRKLGLGDGKYKIPDDINAYDDEIAEMFGV